MPITIKNHTAVGAHTGHCMNEQFSKLLEVKAFYYVKHLKIAYSAPEKGYVSTIGFQVNEDKFSYRSLRFFAKDLQSTREMADDILKCHLQFNPGDLALISLWSLYLEDFMRHPDKGVSLYRPESV